MGGTPRRAALKRLPQSWTSASLPECVSPMCSQVWPMAKKDEKYSVRRISGREQVRGRTYYLVEWKDFGVDDDSWEPYHNILDETLVSDFLAALAPPMTPD